jgi:pyridoxine 5-phosphate synthase
MRLYVNIDHVATLREARRTDEPDTVQAAAACEAGGADGITVHLREDRRHIHDDDVVALRRSVRSVLNLELATNDAIVRLACRLRPYQATLVPERRQEITTEGGLDLTRGTKRLAAVIRRLGAAGIRVSLFVDPTREAMRRSLDLGAPAVELHTGRYAHASRRPGGAAAALRALAAAAAAGRSAGLAVHAGHGLTYQNVQPVAAIAEIEELNIGHTIVSNALYWGLEEATLRMRKLVDEAAGGRPSAVG